MQKIKVNCGCGFYNDGEFAVQYGQAHANKTGHEVEVRGTITKEESRESEILQGSVGGTERLQDLNKDRL